MDIKFVIFISVFVFTGIYGDCPAGWSKLKTRCYYVASFSQKYADAVNYCAIHNATLPIYYTDEEWKFLQELTIRGQRLYQWAGIHYSKTAKTWQWMDGVTKYNKTAFHWVYAKDSQTIPAATEKYRLCAGMYPGNKGLTYLLNCFGAYQTVCQRPADVVDLCDASDGWTAMSGRCYKYFDTKKTWRDARATCQQFSGDLVVPTSYVEQLQLGDVVPCRNQANDIWIGISDMKSPGRYLSTDTLPPKYQRWNRLVTYPVKGDSCVNVLSSQNFYYEADSCLSEHTFICQREYGTCAKGWLNFGSKCFQINMKGTSWFLAKMYCENQGTQLAIIQSVTEQNFLSKHLKQLKQRVTWLGMSDYNDANTQQWISGVAVSQAGGYSHWRRGYPRPPPYKGINTCGSMLTSNKDDTWINIYCYTRRTFICESSVTVPPKVPPSLAFSCDIGWSLFREDCYSIGHGKNRTDSLKYCKSLGAILTTIRDPFEQAFIVNFKKPTDYAWFGLLYQKAQAAYLYDDYSTPSFTNWYPKEPGRLPCIQIVGGSRSKQYVGSWEDNYCNRRSNFICRKQAAGASSTLRPSNVATAKWSVRCGGPGWIDNQNENTCYQINMNVKKWADAKKDCRTKGGELMSISGPHEQIHLQATLSSSQFSYVQNNLWIGGSDRNDNGGWSWSDLSPFRYLNWHPGEPNMLGKGENCMVLTTGAWNYQWDNSACTNLAPYICKRKPDLPPGVKPTKSSILQKPCKPQSLMSGTINVPDNSISVSSSASDQNAGGASRIFRTNKSWWTPLRNTIRESITVQFSTIMVVNGVRTQGRPDNTQWVTKYKLNYQVDSFTPWYTYQDPPGTDKIFIGNTNGRNVITKMLAFPFSASSVSLQPIEWHNGIALKWELLGCVEEDCNTDYALSGPLIVQDGGYKASSFTDTTHSQTNSRLLPLDPNEGVSAWKPKATDTKSWIEVDLGKLKRVRGVTTMGNPSAAEWVTTFKISYWIDDGMNQFHVYQEPYGTEKIFRGNRNSIDKVTTMFKSYFQAQKIRIMPLTSKTAVALRFDLLVCPIECDDIPLLSGNHRIPDEQLSASSRYDNDHGPMRSRLNINTQGDFSGGWLAKYNDQKQFIKVDLGAPIQIVAIATQGRKERNEFVRSFRLAVSNDDITYAPFVSGDGNITLFDGNYDADSVRKQYLPYPVMATYVKLYPVDWRKRIALRWEVYGCPGPQSSYNVGCYADRPSDRDLPHEALTDPEVGLTPDMCVHHCYVQGYFYAGLQNRDNCYCGNSYGKYGAGLNCSIPCPSQAKLQCGGVSDNDIYSTGLTTGTRVCADGWKPFGDRCYIVLQDKLSWSAARSFCQSAGAELVSISDQHEQDFVVSMTVDIGADIWIGFNDQQTEMYFEWSNDEEVLYTNWNLAQPNNPAGTQEDCVLLTYKTGGWQDERCDILRNYMCEMEKQPSNMQTQSPLTPGCDKGWDGFENNCYLVVQEPRMWSDAASVCRSNGGYLIQISDKYEQAYISSKLGSATGFYWTDIRDTATAGEYVFADGGAHIPLSNWARHKPDQSGHCVGLGTGRTAGLWSNMNCTTKASSVCEKLKKGMTTLPPATLPDSTSPCPDGWVTVDIWCYQVNSVAFNLQRNYADATVDCQNKGANLASFHNQSHLDSLRDYRMKSKDHFWFGLNDLLGKGYVYSDGTPVDFPHWDDNEPNNYQGTAEDCVELLATNGKFNDQDCSKLRNWICGIRRGVTLVPVTTQVPPSAGPDGSCSSLGLDNTWKSYNGNCYLVSDGTGDAAKTWRAAQDYCGQYAADLASVLTPEENLFIWSRIAGVSSLSVWIGLNEFNPNGGLSWSDMSPAKYVNWNANEPNDYLGLEACGDMFVKNGKWNDEHCSIKQGFVCKRSLNPVTRPTLPTVTFKGNCPTGFSGFNNKCFKTFGLNNLRLNWSDARAACKGLGQGYELATILNPLEEAFLITLLPNVWWNVWIDMYNRFGTFVWDNNDDSSFYQWAHGEPVNKGKVKQCVTVYGGHKRVGQWNVAKCSDLMGYVCQVHTSTNLPSQQPPTSSCSKGYRPLNKDCVKLYTGGASWKLAKKTCSDEKAKLASINSMYEQSFAYLIANEGTKGPFWIGFSKQTDGEYGWVDQWPVTYTNFDDNQPNSTLPTDGCINFQSNGKWQNGDCKMALPFFCKTTTDTVPLTPPPGTGQCPGAYWTKVGDACYRFDYQDRTYDLAVKYCNGYQATLFSIPDNVTNDYIYSILKYQTSWAVWLGVKRSPGLSYKWLDKSPVNYVNWAKGEPQRKDTGGEELQCAMVTGWQNGQWQACPCSNWMGVICKRPMQYDTIQGGFPTLGHANPITQSPQTGQPQTTQPQTAQPQTAQPQTAQPQTPMSNKPTKIPPTFTTVKQGGFVTDGVVTNGQSPVTPLGRKDPHPPNSNPEIGSGAIAGIVIAAVFVVGFLILGGVYISRRRNNGLAGFARSFSNALYDNASSTENESVQFN